MSVTSLQQSGLLTIRECAEHARVSVTTMRSVIKSGALAGRQIGRCVRVLREDLEAWERSLPTSQEVAS